MPSRKPGASSRGRVDRSNSSRKWRKFRVPAILDYLALKRIFHYRNNSGAFVDLKKHSYGFGALGSPDIICFINRQYVGIEVKASKGKQSSIRRRFSGR